MADDPKPAPANRPGEQAAADVATARTTTAPTTIPGTDGRADRRVIGDPDAPLSPINDPTGRRSNRLGGTIQREPRSEDLPPDAKVAPIAEQVAPNQNAQAIGAKPTPDEVAGVPTEEEGEKNVVPDASDPTQFLPPNSTQHPLAERAAVRAKDAHEDALAASPAVPAENPEGKPLPGTAGQRAADQRADRTAE
jgi:hypothetical protein